MSDIRQYSLQDSVLHRNIDSIRAKAAIEEVGGVIQAAEGIPLKSAENAIVHRR